MAEAGSASLLLRALVLMAIRDRFQVLTITRTGSTAWSGQFAVDQSGAVTGAIRNAAESNIVPGFQ